MSRPSLAERYALTPEEQRQADAEAAYDRAYNGSAQQARDERARHDAQDAHETRYGIVGGEA
jgi:hypothetical protein